jgi:hypothetical protein
MGTKYYHYKVFFYGGSQGLISLEYPSSRQPDSQDSLMMGAYWPGVTGLSFTDDPLKSAAFTWWITASSGSEQQATGKKHIWNLSDPQHSTHLSLNVWHLAAAIQRQYMAERGIFSVHAACITGPNGQAVLLPGHSGTGKTTAALTAVQKGWKIFSGNKTLVTFNNRTGGIQAVAGTRTMTGLSDQFNHLAAQPPQGDYVGQRRAFRLRQEFYETRAAVPITHILLPRLNEGLEKCDALGFPSSLHTLYPLFADKVNQDVILPGGKVFVGTDQPHTINALVRGLTAALPQIPVHSVIGPAPFIQKKLECLTL